MKKKITIFAHLVSEIDISRYKQKAYVNIVKATHRKRPGRHSKRPNKNNPHKRYRGQGK